MVPVPAGTTVLYSMGLRVVIVQYPQYCAGNQFMIDDENQYHTFTLSHFHTIIFILVPVLSYSRLGCVFFINVSILDHDNKKRVTYHAVLVCTIYDYSNVNCKL